MEFPEAVVAEEAGAEWGKAIVQGHPQRGKHVTDVAFLPLASVSIDQPRVVLGALAVRGVNHP